MSPRPPVSLDPEHLRSFVAFATHLSFTRAAREVHLSQPAVHKHVQRLGEALGVALYRREGAALALTDAGARTLAFAREHAARSQHFVDSLAGAEAARPVTLASGEGALLFLIADAVGALHRRGVALRPEVRDGEATLTALRSGEADVGVAASPAAPAGFEARAIARVGSVLIVPKRHRLAERRSVRMRDLEGEALLVPPRPRPLRQLLERSVAFTVAMEVRGWPLTLRMAERGLGAAVVNAFCPAPRGMCAVPVRDIPELTYWALREPGRFAPPQAQAVFDELTR